MISLLEVRDVHKEYGAIRAVDGVSFEVRSGEILGVIGPNGSGKTTLFNAILGQVRPSTGQVLFEGVDVTGQSPLALSRRGIPEQATYCGAIHAVKGFLDSLRAELIRTTHARRPRSSSAAKPSSRRRRATRRQVSPSSGRSA